VKPESRCQPFKFISGTLAPLKLEQPCRRRGMVRVFFACLISPGFVYAWFVLPFCFACVCPPFSFRFHLCCFTRFLFRLLCSPVLFSHLVVSHVFVSHGFVLSVLICLFLSYVLFFVSCLPFFHSSDLFLFLVVCLFVLLFLLRCRVYLSFSVIFCFCMFLTFSFLLLFLVVFFSYLFVFIHFRFAFCVLFL
jgi:hypothetical protein